MGKCILRKHYHLNSATIFKYGDLKKFIANNFFKSPYSISHIGQRGHECGYKGATSGISSGLNASVPFKGVVAPDAANTTGSNAKAYLTILFFDERFNFVQEGSQSLRVGASGCNR